MSETTGYGTGAGLKGWNCRHDFYPFFEGISERVNLPVDITENNKQYEISQKQRAMERSIRSSKRRLSALDGAISVCDDDILKRKLQNQFERHSSILKVKEKRLTEFCNSNGIFKQNDRVRVSGFGKSVSQKAVHGVKRYVDKVEKRGIIKSITIDDFNTAAYGNDIDENVINTIFSTVSKYEKERGLYFNEVYVVDISKDKYGKTILMQTEPVPAGRMVSTRLILNKSAFAGQTLEQINERIKNTPFICSNSLEEATVHECGHAKTIFKKNMREVREIYETLESKGISGISEIANHDGAEAIAEIEVLLHRNEAISLEAFNLYSTFIDT